MLSDGRRRTGWLPNLRLRVAIAPVNSDQTNIRGALCAKKTRIYCDNIQVDQVVSSDLESLVIMV